MMKNVRMKLELMLLALLPIILFTACSDDDDKLEGIEYSFTMNGIPFEPVSWISSEPTLFIEDGSYGYSHYEEFMYTIWGYVGGEGAGLDFTIEPEEANNGEFERYINLYTGKDITKQFAPTMYYGDNEADWAYSEYVGGSVTVTNFDSKNLTIQFNNYTWTVDKNSKSTADTIVLDGKLSMDYVTVYE